MRTQLLEIHPNELNFIFEANKPSSCSIQLTNNSGDHVAFKVKTTSPKKYSVRPIVGLVLPYSTCKFLVTMQAQLTAPADMLCTDKFLVQSTIVPTATIEDDINSSMFLKDVGKFVEEKRLSVILISPPTSPVLSPINVAWKDSDLKRQRRGLKGAYYGTSEVKNQLMTDVYITDTQKAVMDEFTTIIEEDSKPDNATEPKIVKESTFINEEDSKPVKVIEMIVEESTVIIEDESKPMKGAERDVGESKVFNEDESKPMRATERDVEESRVINEDVSNPMKMTEKVVESAECKEDELTPAKGIERIVESSEINEVEILPAKVTELEKEKEITAVKDDELLKLVEDIKDMKSNLVELELTLNKAQNTISELTESGQISIQKIEVLQKRLTELSKRGDRKAQVGFPLLFACIVAVISIILGNLLLHQ